MLTSINGTAPNQNQPVTVLVVDDHRAVREAMRQVVEAADGFAFAGEASGREALSAAGELSPAMVIMDKRMSGWTARRPRGC